MIYFSQNTSAYLHFHFQKNTMCLSSSVQSSLMIWRRRVLLWNFVSIFGNLFLGFLCCHCSAMICVVLLLGRSESTEATSPSSSFPASQGKTIRLTCFFPNFYSTRVLFILLLCPFLSTGTSLEWISAPLTAPWANTCRPYWKLRCLRTGKTGKRTDCSAYLTDYSLSKTVPSNLNPPTCTLACQKKHPFMSEVLT